MSSRSRRERTSINARRRPHRLGDWAAPEPSLPEGGNRPSVSEESIVRIAVVTLACTTGQLVAEVGPERKQRAYSAHIVADRAHVYATWPDCSAVVALADVMELVAMFNADQAAKPN